MTTNLSKPVNILRKQDGTFAKGISGNPSGRPRGARARIVQVLDDIAALDAEAVLAKALEKAKEGDVQAARLIMRRAWPVPRGRPVEGLALPPLATVADAVTALGAILAAVADGALSIEEARDLTQIVDAFRKAHELVELERRVTALEKRGGAHAPAVGSR